MLNSVFVGPRNLFLSRTRSAFRARHLLSLFTGNVDDSYKDADVWAPHLSTSSRLEDCLLRGRGSPAHIYVSGAALCTWHGTLCVHFETLLSFLIASTTAHTKSNSGYSGKRNQRLSKLCTGCNAWNLIIFSRNIGQRNDYNNSFVNYLNSYPSMLLSRLKIHSPAADCDVCIKYSTRCLPRRKCSKPGALCTQENIFPCERKEFQFIAWSKGPLSH